MSKKSKKPQNRAKAVRRQKTQMAKNSLRKRGMPVVSWDYKVKLNSIIPDAFNVDGRISAMRAEDAEIDGESLYFAFSKFVEDFKNPFFEKENELEVLLGQKFQIDTEYDYTLIESRSDALAFVVSRNANPDEFHAILFAHGNLEMAKDENIQQKMVEFLI